MYKLTICDHNCPAFVTFDAVFFIDDLETFEKNWSQNASEMEKELFQRCKAGEYVTCGFPCVLTDPKYNMLQEDPNAEILHEEEIVLNQKEFTLLNGWDWETVIYAEQAKIKARIIRFKNKCYLTGWYELKGVCNNRNKSAVSFVDGYTDICVYGNPVCTMSFQPKEYVKITPEGRERIVYQKEDFKEDSVATYCWITIAEDTEKELRKLLNFESEEFFVRLMRDIPGEAG